MDHEFGQRLRAEVERPRGVDLERSPSASTASAGTSTYARRLVLGTTRGALVWIARRASVGAGALHNLLGWDRPWGRDRTARCASCCVEKRVGPHAGASEGTYVMDSSTV